MQKTRPIQDRVFLNLFRQSAGLVQLGVYFRDTSIDQLVGLRRCHLLGNHVTSCTDGDNNRLIAYFLDGGGFCRGNLIFRCGQTARDGSFQIDFRLISRRLSFAFCLLNDAGSLLLHFFLFALIRRQNCLGFLTQGAGFVQFGFDVFCTLVQQASPAWMAL